MEEERKPQRNSETMLPAADEMLPAADEILPAADKMLTAADIQISFLNNKRTAADEK